MNTDKTYLENWERIIAAKDLKNALIKHFSVLADSKGFSEVLEEIMDLATSARIEKGLLIVKFQEDDEELACYPPEYTRFSDYPVSMQNIAAVHGQIFCGDSLILGYSGDFDFGIYDEDDQVFKLFDGNGENLKAAIWETVSNNTYWSFHPSAKNTSGQAALFPIIHELEDDIDPVDINPGSIFLERMVKLNLWPIVAPELELEDNTIKEMKNWWECMVYALSNKDTLFHFEDDEPLSESFSDETLATIENLVFENLLSLESIPFEKMKRLKKLRITNNGLALKHLKGIEKAITLGKLELDRHRLTEVDSLSGLINLSSISLRYNKIKDISGLSACRKLESIYLSDNPIRDISPISNLPKLETLWIDSCAVKDIDTLFNTEKLKNLSIPIRLSEERLKKFKDARPNIKISY